MKITELFIPKFHKFTLFATCSQKIKMEPPRTKHYSWRSCFHERQPKTTHFR